MILEKFQFVSSSEIYLCWLTIVDLKSISTLLYNKGPNFWKSVST